MDELEINKISPQKELFETALVLAYFSKKTRIKLYNLLYHSLSNFDKYMLEHETEANKITEQEKATCKKYIKIYAQNILVRNMDLDLVAIPPKEINHLGKAISSLEEFKEFYIEGNELCNCTKKQRREIALSDLINEYPIDDINASDFEKKINLCLNYGTKFSDHVHNTFYALKKTKTYLLNRHSALTGFIVYLTMKKSDLFPLMP